MVRSLAQRLAHKLEVPCPMAVNHWNLIAVAEVAVALWADLVFSGYAKIVVVAANHGVLLAAIYDARRLRFNGGGASGAEISGENNHQQQRNVL